VAATTAMTVVMIAVAARAATSRRKDSDNPQSIPCIHSKSPVVKS
jgi:hypothetical protein